MPIIAFRGHAEKTDWRPIPELGNWQLDHVFVSSDQGDCWPCFGRGLRENPNAEIICEGRGCSEWVEEIAGQYDQGQCAGITHQVNGVCQCCANRLLLPAGVNVHHAPGNEIVIPIFGKYGLGLADFVTRVKDAAVRAKERAVDSVSEEQVETAVQSIMRSKDDEFEILMDDIGEFLHVKISSLSTDGQKNVQGVYLQLYDKRVAAYADLTAGRISPDQFRAQMHGNVLQAFCDVRDILGKEAFHGVFGMPPEVAAAVLCGPHP